MTLPSYDRLDMMLMESQGEVVELTKRIADLEKLNTALVIQQPMVSDQICSLKARIAELEDEALGLHKAGCDSYEEQQERIAELEEKSNLWRGRSRQADRQRG